MKIAVIADDFTGANDVGARFREYGLSVVSAFEYYDYGSDVTVIDTGTRNIPDDKAYLKVCRLFCEMKKNGFEQIEIKKDLAGLDRVVTGRKMQEEQNV